MSSTRDGPARAPPGPSKHGDRPRQPSGAAPSRRSQTPSRLTGEEFVALEAESTGKSLEWVRSEELTAVLDQIRFFAGAVNCHLINPAEMPGEHSGDGTDLSLLGLENYTRLKHMMSALG